MSFTETPDDNYLKDLSISTEIRAYLSETAKWATFISIMGFIYVGLMVILSVGMGFYMGAMMPLGYTDMPFSPFLFSFIYLVFALIMLFPILYLYKFASKMKLALKNNDNLVLAESFKNLKSLYKFYGVFIIIGLSFYALMLVVSLIGVIMGSFA